LLNMIDEARHNSGCCTRATWCSPILSLHDSLSNSKAYNPG